MYLLSSFFPSSFLYVFRLPSPVPLSFFCSFRLPAAFSFFFFALFLLPASFSLFSFYPTQLCKMLGTFLPFFYPNHIRVHPAAFACCHILIVALAPSQKPSVVPEAKTFKSNSLATTARVTNMNLDPYISQEIKTLFRYLTLISIDF